MKRAVLALCLILAPAADAGPPSGLAETAGALRTGVERQAKAAADAPARDAQALPADLQRGLETFGLAASRLSLTIDAAGGPADLRCIFRGMAEETGVQLSALKAARREADRLQPLSRLAAMLADAEQIAPAADRLSSASPDASPKAPPKAPAKACPATAATARN